MKKTLILLTLMMLVVSAGFSQSSKIIYKQDFENYQDGDMIMVDKDQLNPYSAYSDMRTWVVKNGVAISTSYYVTGDKTADDWMITPIIELTDNPALMWWAYTPDASYRDGYQVLITTTLDDTVNLTTYTKVFEISAENTKWTRRIVDLSDYAGKKVRIAWRNNSTDKFLLYVDDILVFDKEPVTLGIISSNIPKFVRSGSDYNFSIDLFNFGVETVDNFKINYKVDDNEVVSQDIAHSINFGESYTATFSTPYNSTEDTIHNVTIWISEPNGKEDSWADDDTTKAEVSIFSESKNKLLLVEHFTQASCGPCASQNPALNSAIRQRADKVAHIAIHTSWPGTDPMYDFNKEDSKARVKYYSVTGVPHVVANGTVHGAPSLITTTYIDEHYKNDGLLDLLIDKEVKDDTLFVTIKIVPFAYFTTPVTLQAVLIEDKTYMTAPGSNGETDFPDVMRKFIPDANGTTFNNLNKGDTITVDLKYEMPSEIVKQNCSIVAFIQDSLDKEVYMVAQTDLLNTSTNNVKEIRTLSVYPSITKDYVFIKTNTPDLKNAYLEIIDANGKVVKKINFKPEDNKIDVSDLAQGMYIIRISSNNKLYRNKFVKM